MEWMVFYLWACGAMLFVLILDFGCQVGIILGSINGRDIAEKSRGWLEMNAVARWIVGALWPVLGLYVVIDVMRNGGAK